MKVTLKNAFQHSPVAKLGDLFISSSNKLYILSGHSGKFFAVGLSLGQFWGHPNPTILGAIDGLNRYSGTAEISS